VEIVDSIRRFLGEKLAIPEADRIGVDTPLVRKGVIDSVELMQVVAFLEATYGIRVEDSEIVPKNFHSLQTMADFVLRKRS
jgi:acyl carrier protein